MRKGQIVLIRWMDIVTNLSTADIQEPIEAWAVGRVICNRGKRVVLASGWYTDDADWPEKDTATIPKGCIEEVRVLRDNG